MTAENKFDVTLNILFFKGYSWYLLGGLICFMSGFLFTPLAILGMALIYVVLDLVGWESVGEQSIRTQQSYRILQHCFKWTFVAFAFFLHGIKVPASFLLLQFFGVMDILYYAIGRYNLLYQSGLPFMWTWMGWTPFGILKIPLSGTNLIAQAIIGILITIGLYIFVRI